MGLCLTTTFKGVCPLSSTDLHPPAAHGPGPLRATGRGSKRPLQQHRLGRAPEDTACLGLRFCAGHVTHPPAPRSIARRRESTPPRPPPTPRLIPKFKELGWGGGSRSPGHNFSHSSPCFVHMRPHFMKLSSDGKEWSQLTVYERECVCVCTHTPSTQSASPPRTFSPTPRKYP